MSLWLFIFSICFVSNYGQYSYKDTLDVIESTRSPRIFPFFPIGFARFENTFCTATNGLLGTCYSRRVCNDIGGQVSGQCRDTNLGACCIIQRRCGTTSSYNNTYFVNPNFPNPERGRLSCTIIIPPCNSDICQLRIDFGAFNLAQPNGLGNCVTDSLSIEGGASTIPLICGENTGQHIYVGFRNNESITITVQLGDTTLDRIWSLRIAQIDCSCPTVAPAGCLMFYMGRTGTVNSFNYGRTQSGGFNGADPPRPGTRELANLNYGVCVEPLPGFCGIRWTQVGMDPLSFTVSDNTAVLLPTLPANPMSGEDCTTDFVVIPNPTNFNTDRFCGNQFLPVQSFSRPFVLTVVTNGEEANDISNRGFSLMYEQLPCPVEFMQVI